MASKSAISATAHLVQRRPVDQQAHIDAAVQDLRPLKTRRISSVIKMRVNS
jgi:hypothetical protein